MSTLRTNILETTDSLFNIPVSEIASAVRLANNSNPALGAALIGYNGSTVAAALNNFATFPADLLNSSDVAKGAALVGYNGRTVAARLNDTVNILDYIPVAQHAAIKAGTSTYDASVNIQTALDTNKKVYFPNGKYTFGSTLLFKADGYGMIGESQSKTILNYTGTGTNPAIHNNNKNTTTRLWCTLSTMTITGPNIGGNILVDWKSMQLGSIHKVWFMGQTVVGCTLLNLAAVWTVTEGTYNTISECYFGLMATGISISDGANNNTISNSRFQPGNTNGIGIFLSATAAGRVSVINIVNNGFEFPGNISTGVNVLQNCDGVFIRGNRFEQLLNGIVVGATGNKHIYYANRAGNYFESCTTPVNLSSGATAAAPGIVASGTFTGTGSLVTVGHTFNMTATRTGTGTYSFVYNDTTYPDNGQVVLVQAGTAIVSVSQTSTGFTLTCQNASSVATDAPLISVLVFYNK